MSEQTLQELDELRRQVARLEAENLELQKKLQGQDDGLGLLHLLLAIERGIYVIPDRSEWEFLTREQYILRRGGKLPESRSLKMPGSPRKRAA